MDDKFEIKVSVSYNELWEAVWGSDGMGMTYWSSKIRKPDGSNIDLWNDDWTPNPQDFKVYDDYEEKWHTVTLADLAKGYEIALTQNLTHCGTSSVADLEDADACTGDVIIQLAIFGEVTYG